MSGILDKYNESITLTYNYTFRMLIHLKNIRDNFNNMDDPDEITKEVYRDSIIKKYETLEDLTWKLLSKIFKASGLEINNPRGCYKQAFKEGLIDDIDVWNDILLSRNSTSHIYDEKDYEEIKNKIINQYIDAIERLLNNISNEMM
ncbi:nucleotidyltransferase substrate binding, family protein [Clostridium argentinense CDC 2741]|uniref:Nucleotidyltransferase substrate binding, family protein n=1 Tax=Clostridium argentinense CDC 2741 TaxID=1418104 RepID=A0A0C1UE63_9CLOT|nr:HI0074 family nucleotidyltransferase substrate-binding subunit [Clostridium argentinense]ARC83464.1 nucleotidyltransferase [Clostridium argentinense]KIE45715.1 nucleotidyltransferase substrate binding, family protein [Clostridium argentinense CDC 2741]NFF39089.1 nucleotidyltransferase [Clostridium argentinense]NFP49501.1 nucleotidyltransferase [Clostridium argentinense]NFP74137.1 nucleotidyltransferase [Clostridium argentinense]